mgnify:CR=1 FL=1
MPSRPLLTQVIPMSSLPKLFLVFAAASGVVAVSLGAFGAHALKAYLEQSSLSTWQTAVQYHFIHTLALMAVAVLLQQHPQSTSLVVSATLFALGIVLFSGSLYSMALGAPNWLGPITPLGGACFIGGWFALLLFAIRN